MARPVLTLLAAAAALFPAGAAFAREDQQIWLTASSSVDLDKRWRVTHETVARFGNDRGGLYELETNLLLGFRPNRHIGFWAGYTHDPLYAGGRFTEMEHRAREQVTLDDVLKIGPGNLSFRFRLEQRWREGRDGTAVRFRPFVRYQLPLGKAAILLSHESFVNLNTTSFQTRGGEERMRNQIALRLPVAKRVNAEIGYLNQDGFVPNGADNMDHVATASLSFAF